MRAIWGAPALVWVGGQGAALTPCGRWGQMWYTPVDRASQDSFRKCPAGCAVRSHQHAGLLQRSPDKHRLHHLPGNNGALWQPWPSLRHGPAWTNTRRRAVSAQAFKGSLGRLETRPELPLCPEQEVGAVLIPSAPGGGGAHRHHPWQTGEQPPAPHREQTHPRQGAAASAGSPP